MAADGGISRICGLDCITGMTSPFCDTVNHFGSRIRDDPVLRPILVTFFHSPSINNFGSRIREDPVLHTVQLLQND